MWPSKTAGECAHVVRAGDPETDAVLVDDDQHEEEHCQDRLKGEERFCLEPCSCQRCHCRPSGP